MITQNILIVDDNPINLTLLETILSDLKINIYKAESGFEAVKLVEEIDFSLVLLDIQMPGMDGYETAKAVHAKKKSQDLPIIFVTAYNKEQQDITKGYESGAVDYLLKPINVQILRSKVNVFLKLHEQQKMLEHRNLEYETANKSLNKEIRERKKAEKELDKHRQYLEELVKERTLELEKANEELKSLDRLKDELLETISHELRTPLVSIVGYADTLAECELNDKERQQFSNNIIAGAEQLSRLIEDVLDVAYLSSGKMDFRFSKISLGATFDKAVKQVEGYLLQKEGLTIQQDTPDLDFAADEKRMIQVFNQLLRNSIRFSPPRGIIKISAKKNDRYFSVTLQDQGPGIAKDNLEIIFHKFFQHKQKGTEIAGSGLGLTIVRGIIEAHQGKIWAEDAAEGALIRFRLPYRQNSHSKVDDDAF